LIIQRSKSTITIAAMLLVAGLSGCGSVPGKTGEEQVQTIDQLVERTFADIHQQEPQTEQAIKDSVGYAIMDNKITKIPIVGAGGGYGVAIHTKSQERTYIKMTRFDVGGGWGARSVRPVIIFQNEKKFDEFIRGQWSANAGAEAAAKVGESGAAGGAGSGDVGSDKGYSVHIITDAGVSATVTAGVIRVSPVTLKK
jgi:lipid-binding SYLF domain-containing protein